MNTRREEEEVEEEEEEENAMECENYDGESDSRLRRELYKQVASEAATCWRLFSRLEP